MNKTDPHQHIDKILLQYIEDLVVFKHPADIRFIGDNGGVVSIRVSIKAINPEDVLELDGGLKIRFNQLISVNGRQASNIC